MTMQPLDASNRGPFKQASSDRRSHTAGESIPLLRVAGGVATITLCRPAHRNRLHAKDLSALLGHFRNIAAEESVQAVVLTGMVSSHPPVFCAGYHMQEHGMEADGAGFEEVAQALEDLRPVTLCALNGSVYGGAADLVLACDFAIGVTGIQMRMPAAAIGMHIYPGAVSRFVSRIGLANAKRAFLAAETFGAGDLLAMGYVQKLVAPDELEGAVHARINEVLTLAPRAVQMLKASLNEVARGDFDASRLSARHEQSKQAADFAEARLAFNEHRKPVFKGL